jgi:hypothetical protein
MLPPTTQQIRESKPTEQLNRQPLANVTDNRSRQECSTPVCADGYIDGERYFRLGLTLPTHLQDGFGGYARGFRAGYYLHVALVNQAGLAGFTNQKG